MRTPCNTAWIATLIVFRLHSSLLRSLMCPCFVQYLLFIIFTSAIRLDRLNPVLQDSSELNPYDLLYGHVLVVRWGSRRCPFRSLFYLNLVLFVLIIQHLCIHLDHVCLSWSLLFDVCHWWSSGIFNALPGWWTPLFSINWLTAIVNSFLDRK